jgi:hypothetical protein
MHHRAEQDFIDITTFHEPELNLQRLILTYKCRGTWMTPLIRAERLWTSR